MDGFTAFPERGPRRFAPLLESHAYAIRRPGAPS